MFFRSNTCSCGEGQQFRTIFCDRTPPFVERCDMRQTPNTYRECTEQETCLGEWFIGTNYLINSCFF